MPHHPLVSILMGSDSDYEVMVETAKALDQFGIPFEMTVSSAHRTPERTVGIVRGAHERGIKVIIAGAGAAAHLAGVVAAETVLPVIAVPIDCTSLHGLDALLAMVQMPAGIPVATVAIGKAGARNAGILAAQILALNDAALTRKLVEFKADLATGVEAKAKALEKRLNADFPSKG
jgi:phosphoribosylaminoimidazole carboxylase PurE protein